MRMSNRLIRSLFPALIVPSTAMAQLEPARWTEFGSAEVATCGAARSVGLDDTLPENLGFLLHDVQMSYALEYEVAYGPPGAPLVVVTAHGSCSGTFECPISNDRPMAAHATDEIEFQLRVVETSPPPTTVYIVPLEIKFRLTAGVAGDLEFEPYAHCGLRVMDGGSLQLDKLVFASLGGSESDSHNVDYLVALEPGVTHSVSMYAAARVESEIKATGTWGNADASAGVDFEISRSTIGNTLSTYSDHYTIEYSDGYWALGRTPVEHTTTWGRIKRMY